METKQVEKGSALYQEGVQIRKACFFDDFENWEELIEDPWEGRSIHLVVVNNGKVVGTGRLTYDEDNNGIVSQMAVANLERKRGVGTMILDGLIKTCLMNGCPKVYLSARDGAIEFYEKSGFTAIGAKFPSPKTGVFHISMILEL